MAANPLDTEKLLGKMGVIEQGLLGPRQGHNLLPELQSNVISRPSARISVDNPPGSIARNHMLQSLGMPVTDPHTLGCLCQRHPPFKHHLEKMPLP